MSFTVRTVELDLPPMVAAFGRRLQAAGIPVTPERDAAFAQALCVVRPISRRRLYHTARAVLLSDQSQRAVFDRVFREVFGQGESGSAEPPDASPPHSRVHALDGVHAGGGDQVELDSPVPAIASDEEVLRSRNFEEIRPDELPTLYRMMSRLRVAAPIRRSRRTRSDRRGELVDLRRTLRGSMRTAGDPIRLARRHRRLIPRRLVLICDISGSMEPYARAYIQFLACAAGAGGAGHTEAFVFATRLTRLSRALHARNPQRALQRAADTAPDWSSGTRIGQALKTFNDRHGRRGMARGAVIVILSDGWERGDPGLVAREMERLRRLAYRIIWVNPRAAASGFSPRAGGMAAALPFCDALVSGHNLQALDEVIAAIGDEAPPADRRFAARRPDARVEPDEEPWASATPMPGSSVAMPSGYGPSRGRTTPGWSIG